MTGKLQKEIKQRKPLATLQQEVVLNVMRTAGALGQGIAEVLRPYDLSGPQYNILRILRGAQPDGLPCSEVAERLVSRDPDVTRLLDRMEKRDLVVRGRWSADRRVVTARITKEGVELANRLDAPITENHRQQLGHMKKKRLRALINLLEAARNEPD